MTWIQDSQPRHSGVTARAWLVMTLLVALPPGVRAAEAEQHKVGLFSAAEPSPLRSVAILKPDDVTIRRREVTIDFEMLALSRESADQSTGTSAKLTLNLFDDTVLTAIVNRTVPTSSGYSLSGRIEGVEFGTMTLVVNGTVVAGSVRTPAGTYRIRSIGKRLYAISEVDESKLPPPH